MAERVPPALRRQLKQLAEGRCEYCRYPEALAGYPHEADHIIATQHDGPTSIDNLAYFLHDLQSSQGNQSRLL